MKLRMSRTATILSVLGLLVLILSFWRIVQLVAEEEPEPTVEEIRSEAGVPVVVAQVERGNLDVWRSMSGTVSGDRESIVRARSDDEVDAVNVQVGDRVQAGQIVATQRGEATDARVRQARTALGQAERNVERLRPLWEAGALSDQDWEEAGAALEQAEAELDAVTDVTRSTAPIAGVVTSVPARVGQIPSLGDPLVRIVDVSTFVVTAQVSASRAEELGEGQEVRISGREEKGVVRRISLQVDEASRLVEVEVAFPPETGLRPGSFVRMESLVASSENALLIPTQGLRDGGVWVVDDDREARFREVEVGLRGRDLVEVTSGIEVGERVVVQGASLLADGTLTRIVD